MSGELSSFVVLVLSSCMLAGGEASCTLSGAQFLSSAVTVSAESVGGSTPGARVTWNTTVPPECVASVAVNFRNKSRVLIATDTTTNTSQTEFIQTGLQCATVYTITVVIAGETRDLGFTLQYSTVQILVGAISVPVRVRAEITAANTSVRVSWEWSCQSVLDIVDLVRVHYQPEGGSLMMYTVGNTTATSATLPNLQCNTKYTVWVYARGDLNDSRSLPRMVNLPARAPPTPTGVTAQYVNASSVKVTWQWTSSDPAPSCFNTTTVTYHPEGGDESSLQLSDPAATEATLTDLQCNTDNTITVVATVGEYRREGAALLLQGISSTCQEVSDDPGASSVDPGTHPSSNPGLADTPHISSEVPTQCTSAWVVVGVAVTAVLVLLVVAVVQSVVIWHQRRPTAGIKSQTQSAKTTEIPLKECSAYGQIDQDGGESEKYIYEHPQ